MHPTIFIGQWTNTFHDISQESVEQLLFAPRLLSMPSSSTMQNTVNVILYPHLKALYFQSFLPAK